LGDLGIRIYLSETEALTYSLAEMDSSSFNRFDIFDIYKQFSEIRSRAFVYGIDGCSPDYENPPFYKEELARVFKLAQSTIQARTSIFDEVFKLMSKLDLMVDFSEYSKFYDFVFFICRESGQKNLTVSRAVLAWRLVLAGRFRLLNQWCDFVEKNHRHNISEDTWKQVLAFTRCVHEDLEGYDPSGAWPVLLDDFVEHMHSSRTSTSTCTCSSNCDCDDTESHTSDGCLPGFKVYPGLKRKCEVEFQRLEIGSNNHTSTSKRRQGNDYIVRKNKNNANNDGGSSTNGCSESQCGVDGVLVKGFERLFSNRSGLQFDCKTSVSSFM
jgi:DCN1-like protein 1/2